MNDRNFTGNKKLYTLRQRLELGLRYEDFQGKFISK